MRSNNTKDRDRITIKIQNMKRSASRDSSLRNKRHSSISRFEDSSDERVTPDRLRRRAARSPSPRARYVSPHREYSRPMEASNSERFSYKVLCVSALHPKASDEFIKETLYREYKKFGDFSIRIAHDLEERVAYVCFRTPDDAREAKHAKTRIILYDKVALVEPVYESARTNEVYRSRPRSVTPEYERHYYSRSPGPLERRRALIDPYDHRYGPPPTVVHRPHELRPVLHHEYMPRGPPIHHGPPHLHPVHPIVHHYVPRHLVPRPHVPFEKQENKKDKFPNYLHHVQPEDDPLATRTLFAGNLEINISDEELKRIFGKYGIVEDIDIKRPPPGTGNAFAFVRYLNLDMAHRAKVELSGQYIGKFQCKIGYGKATPTTRIWIGGLGAWTSVTQLEREFDRFGAIKKIEYQKGDLCAYILYESIEAAQAAVKEMRGFPLGGPERKLRLDFSDVVPGVPYRTKGPPVLYEETEEYRRIPGEYPVYTEGPFEETSIPYVPYPTRPYRGRGGFRGRGAFRGIHHPYHIDHRPRPQIEENWDKPSDIEYGSRPDRSLSNEPGTLRSRSQSRGRRSPDSDSDSSRRTALSSVHTLLEVARKCTNIWQGSLILKSSLFPAKCHLTDGDADIVGGLMKDEDGKHHLRITQRLRLDQPKLDDVQKRISSSSSHAIFLGLAGSTSALPSDESGVQTRPLRNLVSYLKQKEAAGVISLLNKETEATGVLYAFPPCDFSSDLLKRTCHNLSEEGLKEDHLVIVVVRGGTA